MGRGEVTLAVMAEFSKTLDTIDPCTVIAKLRSLGFPKKSLLVLQNYLSDRRQHIHLNGIK